MVMQDPGARDSRMEELLPPLMEKQPGTKG